MIQRNQCTIFAGAVLIVLLAGLAFAKDPVSRIISLSNGGKLLIDTVFEEESFFGHVWCNSTYRYLPPKSSKWEEIGRSSCKGAGDDSNPSVVVAEKIIFFPLTCGGPSLSVRTEKSGWRSYYFEKSSYEQYPLWLKNKEKAEQNYDGYSQIIAIDKESLNVVVEYHGYAITKMTFHLSADGEKMSMIKLDRRIDPNNQPKILIAQLTDKSLPADYRANAALHLGILKDRGSVDVLISALSDTGLHVRDYAVESLGKIGDKRAAVPLMTILENKGGDQHTRREAAKALGGIQDRQPVQLLIVSLNDPSPDVRCASAEALGRIGDVAAIDPLVKITQQRHREKWSVRRCAVEALGAFKDPRSVRALNDTLGSFCEKKAVKSAARKSLEKLKGN